MRTRQLGTTGEDLTVIGLGTWAIGGEWQYGWGPQDDEESIAAIHRALDLGVNWIDTAPAYGLGHSEEIVGRAIAGLRDEVFVATKCSRVWDVGGVSVHGRLTAESVRQEAEDSLRRLCVDVIDLYQIHWPDPDEQIEEGWSAIADLIQAGKVRYGGVSNFGVAQLERIRPIHPVASLQPPYSMIRRGIEDDLLPYCAAHGIGVVVYSPMQSGLLTGKYDRARIEALPDGDWRKDSGQFTESQLSANLELVEGLRPIAERNGRTLPQLAIAWTLRRPEVTAAIVGARRPSQIEETAQAASWQLSDEDLAEIDALLEAREQKLWKGGLR
jgi:aryl-alcohol dehydrogenase-like predicted oxidoreductase